MLQCIHDSAAPDVTLLLGVHDHAFTARAMLLSLLRPDWHLSRRAHVHLRNRTPIIRSVLQRSVNSTDA